MLKACDQWIEPLSAYLDGEANPRERSLVEHHLKGCDACRTMLEILRCDAQDTAAALNTRGASEAFAGQVMAHLAQEKIAPVDRYAEIRMPAPEKPRRRASIWEWLVVVSIFAVFSAILFPVFAKSREKARSNTCVNNARQIALAIQMYAQDSGQRLPGENWVEVLRPYDVFPPKSTGEPAILDCPTDTGRRISYVYNAELAGKALDDIADPTATALLWCTNDHNGYRVMAYLDGHVSVERMTESERTFAGKPARLEAQQPAMMTPKPRMPAAPTITPPTKNYGLADKLQIAYKVEVSLESADVQASLEKAELLFRQYDGFVLSSQYQRGVEASPAVAAVSGRVPSENLGKMLVEVDILGTLVSRTVNGDDLTATHLQNLETLGDLRGIQGRVGDIQNRSKPGDALRAEDRMTSTSREATGTRIEEYKLQSRVRLAEITVHITGAPVEQAARQQGHPLLDSLRGALRGLRGFGIWLLSVLIPLLIFLPVWAPLLWLVIWLWKRYGTRRPAGSPPSTE
jgi:prepilin-type processing-associated H-X9-DG protein